MGRMDILVRLDYLLEPVNEPALRTVAAMAWAMPVVPALLVYIIPLVACLNGASLSEVPSEISKQLILLIANAKVWTPANVVIYNASSVSCACR